jgi:hypothetical protein
MVAFDAPLDPLAARSAHRAFVELLKSEAKDQQARTFGR